MKTKSIPQFIITTLLLLIAYGVRTKGKIPELPGAHQHQSILEESPSQYKTDKVFDTNNTQHKR